MNAAVKGTSFKVTFDDHIHVEKNIICLVPLNKVADLKLPLFCILSVSIPDQGSIIRLSKEPFMALRKSALVIFIRLGKAGPCISKSHNRWITYVTQRRHEGMLFF